MLDTLSHDDRMRLLQFVCSFAWADFEIAGDERQFVDRIIRILELDESEKAEVRGWLDSPPPIDAVDPQNVPEKHRELFIKAVEGVIAADAKLATEERDTLALFKQLLTD